MTGRSPRDLKAAGCLMLLTTAVAFPAGFWLSGTMRGSTSPSSPHAPQAAATSRPGRDIYSADVRNDPYVLERQRAVVEAMERDCGLTRAQCPKAAAARRYLNERIAGDR